MLRDTPTWTRPGWPTDCGHADTCPVAYYAGGGIVTECHACYNAHADRPIDDDTEVVDHGYHDGPRYLHPDCRLCNPRKGAA
jgi:hypothetical protein